ncbi:tRNA uridine-5-carboxymethylaminomethyl(34) synthesis GTPase MnmE [Dongia deserti]|uniref:tRNA uridine-5-carboxymethylaminomethyl(34) synthesis GTPase MnmE n=1 Tax=Dongia deserti TaxID=2268030 RepID=UPI000E64B18A|nr:tRNA uridine-5-carboxymethylaminomethyl(34) synthesis GTPase MnmE [Dongia deserti]
MTAHTDTIYALATPPGRSGVAVVRISGRQARAALETLTQRAVPKPRAATLQRLFGTDDVPIDDALVLWFPAPGSFTGEDVAELHLHGGPSVIAATLAALSLQQDLRLAEPGEFTRRAFDNDKLDLAQVEGLADLIAAETEMQRRQALRQAEGELSRRLESWRTDLTRVLARLEAYIDFPDEDLPQQLLSSIELEIEHIAGALGKELAGHAAERLRDGLTIAILGAPNVGKSSILNRLAQREAAIVSSIAGTTRDVIEVRMDIAGFPVTLADTAGLRATADEIEAEGVRRALGRAEHADLKLLVFDGGDWPAVDAETAKLIDDGSLLVVNKADLLAEPEPIAIQGRAVLKLSCKTGIGLESLVETVAMAARNAMGGAELLSRARHRAAVTEAKAALDRARVAGQLELKAEDLRLAVRAIGRITGRVDVEEVLDLIFKEFCIGK